MVFIIFSAFGPDFSAADFVAEHALTAVSVWSKGQPRRSGRLHEDSGLSINFADAETTTEVIQLVESFLKTNQPWIAALDQQPVATTKGNRQKGTKPTKGDRFIFHQFFGKVAPVKLL